MRNDLFIALIIVATGAIISAGVLATAEARQPEIQWCQYVEEIQWCAVPELTA